VTPEEVPADKNLCTGPIGGSAQSVLSRIVLKELKIRWNARTMALDKGKGSFIEDDVPRDDDSVGREVKAAVPFVMSGVT
jgi:hypothetical protein